MPKLHDALILVPAPEFALIPVEGGVLVDGGAEPELLTGTGALTLLPILLSLLDGKRPVAELLAFLPHVPAADVLELLERLVSWGVLDPLPLQSASPDSLSAAGRETLSALKRADPGASLQAARQALQLQPVVVVSRGTRGMGEALCRQLRANGFSRVTFRDAQDNSPTHAEDFVISLLASEVTRDEATAHYRTLLGGPSVFLRTLFSPEAAMGEIGPCFHPGSPLCTDCLYAMPARAVHALSADSDLIEALWTATLASEVTAQLLLPTSPGPRCLRRYHLPQLGSELRTWPRAATCSHRPEGDPSPDPEHGDNAAAQTCLAFAYEEALLCRQEEADSHSWKTHDTRAVVAAKRLLHSQAYPLPVVSVALEHPLHKALRGTQAHDGEKTSAHLTERPRGPEAAEALKELAALLSLSVGLRSSTSEGARRWAPSGGNLGSVEMYVAVRAGGALPPGVYFYQPDRHSLVRLERANSGQLEEVFASISAGPAVSAVLLLSSAYRRIGRKYGAFGYKLSHLDAGAAASQLLLTASALGSCVRPLQGWRGHVLGRALGLRPGQEVVAQVFAWESTEAVGTDDESWSRSRRTQPEPPVSAPTSHTSNASSHCGSVSHSEAEAIVEQLVASTDLVSRRLVPATGQGAAVSWKERFASTYRWRRYPKSVGSAFNERSSTRAFAQEPPLLRDLHALLRLALEANISAAAGLDLQVLVQRAVGLESAVYAYDVPQGSLVRKGATFPHKRLRSLFLQGGYEDCPLVFWFSTDVCAIDASDPGGYQSCLLRAGYLAHRLWMAALTVNLSGVVLAGITAETTAMTEQLIGARSSSLVAFLCGYPVPSAGERTTS